ncbi:MAG: AAA family ATPase [Rhodoblastus sp.]|nr:MAG: AAA family ATPase [Rhodoblastus sp.]
MIEDFAPVALAPLEPSPPPHAGGEPANDYQPPGEPTRPATLPVLESVIASSLAGRAIRPRQWLVDDWIPARNVTLLSGDGGTGKSLLALQLAAAVARGKRWLRLPTAHGRALYLSAEDELDEVHRRLDGMISDALTELDDLTIVPLAGRDAVMAVGGKDALKPTPMFEAFRNKVEAEAPTVVILDNLADIFAGNEIERAHARQFVSMLRGAALDFDCAVVVLAHPSLSGLAAGTGSSGSTAWANSVRSRLYFSRTKPLDGERDDADARTLTRNKSNYSAVGEEIALRYNAGAFVPSEPELGRRPKSAARRAERCFLTCLRRFDASGRSVSADKCATFAPNQFAPLPEAKGLSRGDLAAAMERLFARGAIQVETTGPASRRRSRIVERSFSE